MDLAGSLRVGTGSYGSRIQFSRSGLGDELVIGVDGYGNSTANEATIQSSINSPRPLVFATNNTERLRILSNGQIGINTATPINDFTLLTDGNGYVDFHGSGGGGAEMNVYKKQDKSLTYKFANNGGANELAQHYLTNASGKYLWYIGGTSTANEKMRLDNNGRLGIGTNSPSSIIHATGSNSSTGYQFINTHTTSGFGAFIKEVELLLIVMHLELIMLLAMKFLE